MRLRYRLVILLLLLVVGGAFISKASKNGLKLTSVYSFNFNDTSLESIVQNDLQNQPGNYAVFIQDLTDDSRTYSFNADQQLPSASLYKLVVMAETTQMIKDNKLTMDTQLSSTKSHLDSVLDNETSEYPDAPEDISYTVGECLSRIAHFSDNYAAVMLTEKIRQGTNTDPIQQMAKILGMNHTDFTPDQPVTTAQDIGTYFMKLYQGQVVSADASKQIIDLLSQAENNDRIPAQLPQGLKIAHKTGEFPYLRHDAGIVFLDQHPYVIVLMSQNLQHEDDGVALEAKISKDVYDYFNQLH